MKYMSPVIHYVTPEKPSAPDAPPPGPPHHDYAARMAVADIEDRFPADDGMVHDIRDESAASGHVAARGLRLTLSPSHDDKILHERHAADGDVSTIPQVDKLLTSLVMNFAR